MPSGLGLRLAGALLRHLADALEGLVDDLDLGLAPEPEHDLLRLALQQRRHDAILDALEGRQRLLADLLDLDDVPSKLGLNRL